MLYASAQTGAACAAPFHPGKETQENMLRSQKRKHPTLARSVRWSAALLGLAAFIAFLVALACHAQSPATRVADPLTLSLQGVKITSQYSGDPNTGARFTAVVEDLGAPSLAPPEISAPSALLVSMDTGRVLFSHNPEERRAMASITKIMTALLVLEKLPLEQRVTATARAEATDESQLWLEAGEMLTVEELLCGLLVGSANDAAVALAEAAAESVEAFVSLMNEKAGELGLAGTHFANPHGLDAPEHYSSARDLATLARHTMKNPEFRKLAGTRTCTIPGSSPGSVRTLTNHNKLLEQGDWVTGIKTGFTDDAGFCLVASGEEKGVGVVSVILGESSKDLCWSDSQALLEYGLTQCHHITLIEEGTAVAEAEIPYEPEETLWLVTEEPVELNLSGGEEIAVTVTIDRELVLPVQAGEGFGTMIVAVAGETLDEVALVAEAGHEKPTLGDKLRYFWSRLVR
jgi:D-alanyl-D-alanine carboxypeptidase (penicillin-binding protein 5/6)